MGKLENENSVQIDGRNSGTLCQFCGKKQDTTTCLISPTASLHSSNSSVSCYSMLSFLYRSTFNHHFHSLLHRLMLVLYSFIIQVTFQVM